MVRSLTHQRGPGNFELSRRRLLATGSAALAATAMPGLGTSHVVSAVAQENQVVTTGGGGAWEAALKTTYFEPFTEETGIEVVIVDYPTDAELQVKIETNTVDVDLVEFGTTSLVLFAQEGLVEPIDLSFFSEETVNGLLPEAKIGDYGIATSFGSVILGYRTDVFSDPESAPQTWADFWDTAAFPGARTLGIGDGPTRSTLEIALLADGVAAADLYPIDFDRAFASLDRIKDDIVTWWETGTQSPQMLSDQEVDLASAYNGRITDIAEQGVPAAINWNQGILYAAPYAVPKGAPNRENAMQLLAYMSDAKREAEFSMLIAYGPGNGKAFDYIPAERAAVLNTAPDLVKLQIPQDVEFWAFNDESGTPMLDVAAERWLEWVAG